MGAVNSPSEEIARQHIAKGISKTFVLVDEYAAMPKAVLGVGVLVGVLHEAGDPTPTRDR